MLPPEGRRRWYRSGFCFTVRQRNWTIGIHVSLCPRDLAKKADAEDRTTQRWWFGRRLLKKIFKHGFWLGSELRNIIIELFVDHSRVSTTAAIMKLSSVVPGFALPLLAAASGPSGYGVISSRSGSPIHLLSMTASGLGFYLGGNTSTYCPTSVVQDCPPGTQTILAPGGAALVCISMVGEKIK